MKYALSAFFWLYMFLSLSAFWFAVVIPWLVILPFDRRRVFSHWYAITWATHYVALSPFWAVDVYGRENIADDKAYVLTANHQSAADIIALFCIRKHFKWVSKASVFLVPFLGWMMWMANYIGVRRGDAASRRAMLDACKRELKLGSSVMMFPEGTRSLDGELRPFKRGAFAVATECDVPVVPIVLEGTHNALPKGSWVFQQRGQMRMQIHILPPIEPAQFEHDPVRLMKATRAAIAAKLVDLRSPTADAAGPTPASAPAPATGL